MFTTKAPPVRSAMALPFRPVDVKAQARVFKLEQRGAEDGARKVDMHDDGVVISDFDARPRPDDPAWPTLDPIARGQLMPLDEFISEVAPLKVREIADRCRYAIEVRDSTGRTNKPGYKHSMGRLWGVFQLHEVDN